MQMLRGQIWLIDFPEVKGSITKGVHPGIIVSNDKNNVNSNVINVVSLTSKNKKLLPTHIPINKDMGLYVDSTALCEQPLSVPKELFIKKVGSCDKETMYRIAIGLCVQLDLFNELNINNINYA